MSSISRNEWGTLTLPSILECLILLMLYEFYLWVVGSIHELNLPPNASHYGYSSIACLVLTSSHYANALLIRQPSSNYKQLNILLKNFFVIILLFLFYNIIYIVWKSASSYSASNKTIYDSINKIFRSKNLKVRLEWFLWIVCFRPD